MDEIYDHKLFVEILPTDCSTSDFGDAKITVFNTRYVHPFTCH